MTRGEDRKSEHGEDYEIFSLPNSTTEMLFFMIMIVVENGRF